LHTKAFSPKNIGAFAPKYHTFTYSYVIETVALITLKKLKIIKKTFVDML